MKTKLVSKGQVVLPASARKRLGLLPGGEVVVTGEENLTSDQVSELLADFP